MLGAKEIDDEAKDDLLASEFQTWHSTAAQQFPCDTFTRRGIPPHSPRGFLFRWIHRLALGDPPSEVPFSHRDWPYVPLLPSGRGGQGVR